MFILNNIKYLYMTLLLAILLLAGSALWLVGGVLSESQGIDRTPRDTLMGMAAQTSHELSELIYALDGFAEADPNISKNMLLNKFDILWSREITNSSGNVGRAFAKLEGVPQILQKLRQLLRETEEQIIDLKPGDKATAKALSARYKLLVPGVYNIWRISSKHVIKQTSDLYAQFESVSYWTTILIILICVTSCLVTLIIWKERQALENLNRHLEERVEDRTKDLRRTNQIILQEARERQELEEKLLQSQKMEVVGQLTGGIAHDFNNLLAIIQGNAELLDDYADEKDRRLIAPILKTTQRGNELTSRLLAFSRKQPLRPETVNLGVLVQNMIDLLDRTLGETVTIDLKTDENLWSALVDTAQMENALLNLAVNARQAMPSGGTLSIETKNITMKDQQLVLSGDLKPGDYVALFVSDTGIGMSDDVISHAFEPFFTTKDAGQGSGLGLSMVYGFIQQSGGAINIYSEVGIGSTIKLYIPRDQSSVVTISPITETETPMGNGETVLVLEDEPEVLKLAQKLLQSLNYTVLSAKDTAEATQLLNADTQISVILSDVVLPGSMTGPEFFKENSALVENIKIIFMSGYPAETAAANKDIPLWDPADILLNKPFSRGTLARQIRQTLETTKP